MGSGRGTGMDIHIQGSTRVAKKDKKLLGDLTLRNLPNKLESVLGGPIFEEKVQCFFNHNIC